MASIPKISFPVPANGRGQKFGNAEELLSILEGESSGLYLVGSQGMWHGGIHITDATVPWCAITGSNASELAYVHKPYAGEQAVSCMADGKIVAYRVCDDYDFVEWRGDKVFFSTSFVLVEHNIQPGEQASSGLKFHTLYMNLAPVSAYGQGDVYLRETAKGQKYYSSQDDVNTATASGTLPAGTEVKLGAQVMTSSHHHRQFCEVTVVKDTGSLHAGDKIWTVSDRGWLKPQGGQAKEPSWWSNCSPVCGAESGTQQIGKTTTTMKCYLSTEDISSGKDCGNLAKDFPVTVDTDVPSFTRVSDSRVFSLVTLGQDNNPLKKGDRVWVVSDNDNLTAEGGATVGQPKYGEVVIPATPLNINAGDSIGHLGFYELPEENGKRSRYQVHIECLSADSKLPTFLTNPDKVGEENPAYLTYAEGADLYMPDAQGKMVKSERKSRAPGILTLSKVPGVDADGKALSNNAEATYYQIRPEGGWMEKSSVKKVAQFDLAGQGFVTLDKAPESFDLIDGIHHPDNVVKGILSELYKAAQNETDSSRKLNQYNYDRLLKQIDTNQDGQYSEQEYLQAVHNPSYRDHLYRLIVKHPSEWYYGKDDAYWKVYLDTLAADPSLAVWKTYTEAFISKMSWMKQVPGMVAEPWHMHPVVFLDGFLTDNDGVTYAQLKRIFPDASDADINTVVEELRGKLQTFKLDTPTRLRHFFSQIKGEVGPQLKGKTEGFQFSPATLRSFSQYYREHPTESENDGYEKNASRRIIRRADEQAIGRKHYLRLNGNRQSNPDDGYNFRGRGLIQVTGYGKYHGFMEEYNNYWQGNPPNTVEEPEKINEMPYAIRSAIWFWLHYEVYSRDQGNGFDDVISVTRRVNGGTMGLDERQTAYQLCEGVFL
ncbi:hypothetical protein M8S51_20095 [Enterobacter chengduensis]|uniref:glycoside hydrolase family 19 protein n=1 Tax=Enterobacter chengduensis TaxID=2494701 RepID=UPI00097C2D1C|nr:hypothetical protein [Enterobacter chengduensis]MCM7676550.1 hypothetical protein [Enterobacter chengduensis]